MPKQTVHAAGWRPDKVRRMDTRLAEMFTRGARDRLIADGIRIDESRLADTDCAGDDLTAVRSDRDEGADDSVIVVTLDGDEIVGYDDGDDSGGGGWGDGGGCDDDAPMRAPIPWPARQSELSDERRDRVIVMMVAALTAGTALLIGGIVLAGAVGWIEPACGGILAPHTATCRGVSQPYTTLDRAVTPDWSRYRLDTPADQEQPTP